MKNKIYRKCPGCNSSFVCWNWVAPTPNHQQWSHECWACGNCYSTNEEVNDGIPYEELNTPDSKGAVEEERKSIICHKLLMKNGAFDPFARVCGKKDEKQKWDRAEYDWNEVTCKDCLGLKNIC